MVQKDTSSSRLAQVKVGVASVQRAALRTAEQDTQALFGEFVDLLDETLESYVRVKLRSDGYEGYMLRSCLHFETPFTPTHRVRALQTFLFPTHSIKIPPVDTLPFGAEVHIIRERGALSETITGEFIPTPHLAPLDAPPLGFIDSAKMFLHTPYLWGGKSAAGIDCSGLVQVALQASGVAAPRDSAPQSHSLGRSIGQDLNMLQAGDLLFWKGHVAICVNNITLIHANAHHMMVAFEGADAAVARIAAAGSALLDIRRLF